MDAYEMITNKILETIAKGVNPWRMPWKVSRNKDGSINAPYWSRKGRGYSFLNCQLLSLQGKSGGEFITIKQANAEGGRVKKGAVSAFVVFWCTGYKSKGEDANGNEVTVYHDYGHPVLKWYRVFSVDDCEGLKPKGQEPGNVDGDTAPDTIESAEDIVNGYYSSEGAPKLEICQSNNAYYSPSRDSVTVPRLEQYTNPAEYYSTIFHESVHSTGHKSRLARPMSGKFNDREAYAAEELCAEIGSAFLCSAAGIDDEEAFNNSAAYLDGWAKYLKKDKRAYAVAAARAEKAARWILGERDVKPQQ